MCVCVCVWLGTLFYIRNANFMALWPKLISAAGYSIEISVRTLIGWQEEKEEVGKQADGKGKCTEYTHTYICSHSRRLVV